MTSRLGLIGLDAIVYYTHDLERSRRFYVNQLDFAEIARSSPILEVEGGQRAAAFQAGEVKIFVQEPVLAHSRAGRFLAKHPPGIGTLVFEVRDAHAAFEYLDARGATPIGEVETYIDVQGALNTFSITTPLGGTTFRFVERRGYMGLRPGFIPVEPTGPSNRFGFEGFDHVTSNFETMKPALLWMEHVLGFEPYWDIAFHTSDVAGAPSSHGSGLRSQVMWDPESGVKFANNEPWRPHFKSSQVNAFTEEQRGDGVQHVAMTVGDIQEAVGGLRGEGVRFMKTPETYYDALPSRLVTSGIGTIDEDLDRLRDLQILVDGDRDRSYLLQIFLEEGASYHEDAGAGPFFYELIQRKGDDGFGGGNFRALFESIERAQVQVSGGPY
ncbi:MAG: 4-hydroxyphenylpyruvate dioxygenase family protein [Myxococcota bacterium]